MIPLKGFKEFLRATLFDDDPAANVFLVKADFDDADTALDWSDLTEADYPGYAQQVFWDGIQSPDLDSHPWGRIISPTFTFTPSGIVTPQTIYGVGVVKVVSASNIIVAINKFDAPVMLASDTHRIERGIDFYSRSFTP